MVGLCENENGGSVEISGRNGSITEKERSKTKTNFERYSEKGFGINKSGRECGIISRKMEKDHRKANPYLNGKYSL